MRLRAIHLTISWSCKQKMGFSVVAALIQVKRCDRGLILRLTGTFLLQELTEKMKRLINAEEEEILCQKLIGINQRQRVSQHFEPHGPGQGSNFLLHLLQLLLERAMYEHEWNVGSASIIRILSQADLFNMAFYLTRVDPQEQQNIFNDLIETEHFLLCALIKGSIAGDSSIGRQLRNIIFQGINHLLDDLLSNPTLAVPNYLQASQRFLSPSEMEHFLQIHLNALFERDSCSASEAVAQQYRWAQENVFQGNDSLHSIGAAICGCVAEDGDGISSLLSRMSAPEFRSWKFGLAVLDQILSANPEQQQRVVKSKFRYKLIPIIFIYFSLSDTETVADLFTGWISKRSVQKFHVMMLLARQMAYSAADKNFVYQQWYKFQIAEINYTLKSKDDFQYALKTLTATVPLESDPDILRVHIGTPVPAPPYCKCFVTTFKELSKRREIECLSVDPKSESLLVDDDDVIVID